MDRLIIVLFIVIVTTSLSAQEENSTLFNKQGKNDRFDAGAPILSPAILPSYTPEMGFCISGGLLLTFKTRRNNEYLSHSDVPLIVTINPEKDVFVSTKITSFWLDDLAQLYLAGSYTNRNDNYWGVGIDKGLDVEKGNQTTSYHNNSYQITPSLLFRVAKSIRVGVQTNINSTKASELSDLMHEDESIGIDTTISTTGIGLVLRYDSRNEPTNPSKGIYLSLDGLFYDKSLSTGYNYQTVSLSYRQFRPFLRKGSVLAWQFNSRLGFGDLPWSDMSTFGNTDDLRGYYYGRFRDQSMFYALLEYRHTFYKKDTEDLSRHGFVYWIGGGSVFPDLKNIKKVLFNTGLGYRYKLQPGRNLRIDLGFGNESVGLFLSFNESF